MDDLATIVGVLSPHSSEERARLVRAAMVLLGDDVPAASSAFTDSPVTLTGLSPKAAAWMKQNGLTSDQLQQAFHVSDGAAEFIGTLPGNSKKEQTYNAYIVTGIGQLLVKGEPSFEDKAARALCISAGCYDNANHSSHLKDRGNEFTGSKDKGWTLTAPGLKRGAEIIKQILTA